MATSIFIAKMLGPCFIIIAAGIMFNREAYQKVMEDFCKNAALLYFGGLISLVFGLLVILFHNSWVVNWTVIITIFGWGGLIKGIWLIAFPNTVSKFVQVYQKNKNLLIGHSILVLVLGTALTIFGYFMG